MNMKCERSKSKITHKVIYLNIENNWSEIIAKIGGFKHFSRRHFEPLYTWAASPFDITPISFLVTGIQNQPVLHLNCTKTNS